ncbi:MAG: hypothetical protein JO316_05680 [Abitibacteriaceae bacterium]|nr:hypothetical protein [Abditibacteriaceae bacterium]MBV9864818.1 hypothetical protein [Abditibacteriaceae bacterium]
MQLNQRMTRGIALLAGGAMAVSSFHATPVQAADKGKTYKAGAAILGAASALMILKGKTLPGILAGAGAYYAYKKGKDAQNDQNYAQYPDDNGRYSQNTNDGRYSQYPTDNGGYYGGDNGSYNNGSDNNGRYNDGSYNNGNYNNGSYNNGYGNYDNSANYPTNQNNQDYNRGNGDSDRDGGNYRNDGNYSTQETYSNNSSSTSTNSNGGYYPDYGYQAFSRGQAKSHKRDQ